MVLAVLFAVASAFSNAAAVVAQHLVSIAAPRREKGLHLLRYLSHQPIWLLSWFGAVGAFGFQALALHFGLLSVVQPLLISELVFVLVLRWLWIGQHISGSAWLAAALASASLAAFLTLAEPTGGTGMPARGSWLSAMLAFTAAIAVLTALGIRGSPGYRAAMFAAAASLTWALMATFIKTATQLLATSGFVGFLQNWSPYAMAGSAVVGGLLEQTALHVGPLSVSEPLLVVINPLASVGLSVWVFNEHFTAGNAQVAVAFFAFAIMTAAIVWLSQAAPKNMAPDHPASTHLLGYTGQLARGSPLGSATAASRDGQPGYTGSSPATASSAGGPAGDGAAPAGSSSTASGAGTQAGDGAGSPADAAGSPADGAGSTAGRAGPATRAREPSRRGAPGTHRPR